MVDKIFRNGEIVDGTGKARYAGDVAVEGEKIVAMGDLGAMEAEEVVDINGKVIKIEDIASPRPSLTKHAWTCRQE